MYNSDSDISNFNELFSKYQKRFIFFAQTYLKDTAAAEDIVMESFLYYWENRMSLAPDSNVPAYILKIVKNKSLNQLRSIDIRLKANHDINNQHIRVLQTQMMTLEACDPQELFSSEAQQLIQEGLASLSPQTRDLFIRSRYENQTYREIADELGISIKTVEFHISKALKVLRIALKDYFPLFFFF